jgi:formylglycine-generating enzyme required for sulfatase activity
LERRAAAATALAQTGAGFWSLPYGEPEWVEVPTGAFLMGSDQGRDNEKPPHRLHLETFWIARTPITNAQYLLFVQAANHRPPSHWEEGKLPKGRESHSVVYVDWFDAVAYCGWLSQVTGQVITLPSEAEWEKAARGTNGRLYPWGNEFDRLRCNTHELGMGDTTPVGIFPEGASPYGVLEMSGNVWEWTNSQYWNYPYQPEDGREGMDGGPRRVLRGGAWYLSRNGVRAASRFSYHPGDRNLNLGFRVVVRRPPSH